MQEFSMSQFANKADLYAAKAAYRAEMEPVIRQRIADGERSEGIPLLMQCVLGCNYDVACEAVFSGNKERALSLVDEAARGGH